MTWWTVRDQFPSAPTHLWRVVPKETKEKTLIFFKLFRIHDNDRDPLSFSFLHTPFSEKKREQRKKQKHLFLLSCGVLPSSGGFENQSNAIYRQTNKLLGIWFFDFSEIGAGEGVQTPTHDTHHTAQTVIDLLAVFGAMFVAGVLIILITVYFRWVFFF